MAAVQISGASFPGFPGRIGPFQDNDGNLWVVAIDSNMRACVWKSTDGGDTWPNQYGNTLAGTTLASASGLDAVLDGNNEVLYVFWPSQGLFKFTFATTTWSDVTTSGSRPTVNTDVNGKFGGFLVRRSTGEFVVFYQGPTHSSMGSQYRSVYYARCSAAGVWSSGVEVDGGSNINYDVKSVVLGSYDRVHMFFTNSSIPGLSHRGLSGANSLETAVSFISSNITVGNYYAAFYNSVFNTVIAGPRNDGLIYRAVSTGPLPSWSTDANVIGSPELSASGLAFIYNPNDGKLYAFYRDTTTDDVYKNNAPDSGTTWGTADQQDAATAITGISVGPIWSALSSIEGLGVGGANSYPLGSSNSYLRIAQSFIPNRDGSLTQVLARFAKLGNPTDDLILEIQTDNAGSPSGTVVGTVATIAGTDLTTTQTLYKFSCDISLVGGTTYWLVFCRSGAIDGSNYYNLDADLTGSTLPGQSKSLSGSTWFTNTSDLSVELCSTMTDIGIVFNDSNVYFDKLTLVSSEPILPVTANEEFFALL